MGAKFKKSAIKGQNSLFDNTPTNQVPSWLKKIMNLLVHQFLSIFGPMCNLPKKVRKWHLDVALKRQCSIYTFKTKRWII